MILSTIDSYNYICTVAEKNCSLYKDYEEVPLLFNLNALAKNYYGAMNRFFEDLDIDRYFFVLSLIVKHKTATQQGLANCLDIDKASMVRIIDYLVEHGYVKREVNEADRREHMMIPTAKALKLYPRIIEAFRQQNREAFAGFSKEEKQFFYNMLGRMFQNLSGLSADQYFVKYIRTPKKKAHEK